MCSNRQTIDIPRLSKGQKFGLMVGENVQILVKKVVQRRVFGHSRKGVCGSKHDLLWTDCMLWILV